MRRPKVGLGVAICDGDQVLLGLRKGRHQPGVWSFPGGHLEGGEDFQTCALREVEEETGIVLPAAFFWTAVNTIYWNEGRHYVTILMTAPMPAGQTACVMEPEKCERWQFFPWPQLPSPLMQGVEKVRLAKMSPLGGVTKLMSPETMTWNGLRL